MRRFDEASEPEGGTRTRILETFVVVSVTLRRVTGSTKIVGNEKGYLVALP
jgi:hypothetical protein